MALYNSKCCVACLHGNHVCIEISLCIVLLFGHAAFITHMIIPEVIMSNHTE